MKAKKLTLVALATGFILIAAAGVGGCSKSAGAVPPVVSSAAGETSGLAQRVPVDRGAFNSRLQTTLLSREGGTARLTTADGRTVRIADSFLPETAVIGSSYILALALTDNAPAAGRIEHLEPAGTADISTERGPVSLPASLLPSQARQQGHVLLRIYDTPRPLQAISFDARVIRVAADTVAVSGESTGASFELPRYLVHYPDLQVGDLYRITLTSTNEPNDDWSGIVARRERDSLTLTLNAAGREVQYPRIYAPQAVQEGDFFALTLIKVRYQPGDLTETR